MKMISKFELEAIQPTCKTITELASKVGLSIPTLVRQLKMYELPTSYRRKGSNFRISKDQLEKMYLEELKSLREIASLYNVSHQAVAQWLEVYDIKARDMHDPNIKKKYPKNRKPRKKKSAVDDTTFGDMQEETVRKTKNKRSTKKSKAREDKKASKPSSRPRGRPRKDQTQQQTHTSS
jgi:hypothetical protein